jgi:serine protease SohB
MSETIMALVLFTGKSIIVVVAVAILLVVFFTLLARARGGKPLLDVEDLNRKYDKLSNSLKARILKGKALKADQKAAKKKLKALAKEPGDGPRIFVLDFNGDLRASHVDHLREEISAILTMARPGTDEVVVRLESPGGMAHAYGLGATQLMRVREAGLTLTVCVDKVAASGGYMMACTANRILAAPFAIIGSIGVVAQVPNFHRLLKKNDVDFEEVTAGEFKRTISLFGEITDKGRQKFQEQLEDTHHLFKAFVKDNRPQLDLTRVATGEYWFGRRALDLGLVDDLMSSDTYLFQKRETARLYRVELQGRKKWSEKLAESVSEGALQILEKAWLRYGPGAGPLS